MKRVRCAPRPDWQSRVEELGFIYHTTETGQPYWDESVYYEFSHQEIDELEKATYELNTLCLEAVESLLLYEPWEQFGIPAEFAPWIRQSWERDEITIVGRFDLLYDGVQPPKLLEFNADTPTGLLEAAVVQWHWWQDKELGGDQFNSLHEKLIEAWQRVRRDMGPAATFTALEDHAEDFITVNYLRDVALQAGLKTQFLPLPRIGWNSGKKQFVDVQERNLATVFKLYPWEWLVREQFGRWLPEAPTRWLEPPWKMLLSNKALLPWLWRMHPGHPNLLPASWEPLPGSYVQKPLLGREGANVTIHGDGAVMQASGGAFAAGPFIYQEFFPTPPQDGMRCVLGSWLVNGHACGLGVREDEGLITSNTSRFVPHFYH